MSSCVRRQEKISEVFLFNMNITLCWAYLPLLLIDVIDSNSAVIECKLSLTGVLIKFSESNVNY